MTSAASVKARLKNQAVASGKTMQEVLTAYGLERTVFRLSVSEYTERFTLKGGIFLYALFDGEYARVTRDIDLLARNMPNSVEDMRSVFEDIFFIECDDALRYDLSTLKIQEISEFKKYHGVRVSIAAYLDRIKIPISIDVGFGDVIYPDRVKMEFPTLLDMEIPQIYAYSIYSAIAEKFEAIASLGDANSRYKDFYDIFVLAGRCELLGMELKEAVSETFERRGTSFTDIFAFEEDFMESDIHQRRWKAFLKKKKAMIHADFAEVILLLKRLLLPVVDSIENDIEFSSVWDNESLKWE